MTQYITRYILIPNDSHPGRYSYGANKYYNKYIHCEKCTIYNINDELVYSAFKILKTNKKKKNVIYNRVNKKKSNTK